MDLDFVSVDKKAEKTRLGHYPAILTSLLTINAYTLFPRPLKISAVCKGLMRQPYTAVPACLRKYTLKVNYCADAAKKKQNKQSIGT